MNIGRNDPCPCGSGEKYKKCCLNKETGKEPIARSAGAPAPAAASKEAGKKPDARSVDDYDLIAPGEIGDYGPPYLSRKFFSANPLEDFSAQRLVWNMAMNPDLGSQVTKIARQFVSRGKDEARRIKKAESAEELVRIMKENPDPLNHTLLFERVLKYGESIPLILKELAEPQRNSFAELAVQVLFRSHMDVVDELLALVNKSTMTAYDLSLVCMLLGMWEAEEAVKPLWDCFHFFKKKFPRRNYAQGPLIGLWNIKHRRDNPIEVSEEERIQAEESLRRSGLAVSPATAEAIVKLLYQRRPVKVIRILCDETGVGIEQAAIAMKNVLESKARSKKSSKSR
jgi:hypothetical protein